MRKNIVMALCLLLGGGGMLLAERTNTSKLHTVSHPSSNAPLTLVESTKATAEENSCYVTVYKSNGDLAKYVTVSTSVSGGLFCSGGRDFTTNDSGRVRLFWGKDCKLEKVYVKGTAYKVNYKDGQSYTLTLE